MIKHFDNNVYKFIILYDLSNYNKYVSLNIQCELYYIFLKINPKNFFFDLFTSRYKYHIFFSR